MANKPCRSCGSTLWFSNNGVDCNRCNAAGHGLQPVPDQDPMVAQYREAIRLLEVIWQNGSFWPRAIENAGSADFEEIGQQIESLLKKTGRLP